MGASTHPCLTPCVIAKVSQTSPPFLTFTIIPVCKFFIMVVNFSGHPYFLSSYHSPVLPTVSNAFVKSTKTIYRGRSFSMHFSWSCHRQKEEIYLGNYYILFGLLFVYGDYVGILPGLWYMAFLPYVDDPSVQFVDKLAPPYFHTSAGIPSPPGTFQSFSPLIALTISSIVGFSSRAVLTLCFYMFSSTSGSMSPGTLSNF